MEYIIGDDQKFQKPWNEVDMVYVGMNVKANHWVLLEIDISSWLITVYDSF